MVNQRQATVSTLLSVLSERGVNYELGGTTPISEVLTASDKAKARDIIVAGFKAGKIQMSSEFKSKIHDENYLKSYVGGLVNNWIRKAPEFNNDSRYTPKNPGSRAGSGDEQVREMKKLLHATQDERARDIIQEAINARMAELKPTVEIDVSLIPESLKAKLGL